MRNLRNKGNQNNSSHSPTRDTTESNNLDADIETVLHGLRSANVELVKSNAKQRQDIAALESDRLKLINQVSQLTTELLSLKGEKEDINMLAQNMVLKVGRLAEDLVYLSTRTKVRYSSNTVADTSLKNKTVFNMSNGQQTRAVKPMISGHTIQNPVINLPRVSPEQLERLRGGILNDANMNSIHEVAEVPEVENGDGNATVVDIQQNAPNEINENNLSESEENGTIETSTYNHTLRLATVLEETEPDLMHTSGMINTRRRYNNHTNMAPLINTSPIIPDISMDVSSLASVNDSDSILSNALRTSQRIVVRRRQRNVLIPVENATTPVSSPSPNATFQPVEEMNGLQDSVMSNTLFIDGLVAGDAASTPIVSVGKQRVPIDNMNASSSRVVMRRPKMPQCSVIVKRLSGAVKRKSISPRTSKCNEESNETDASGSSTLSISANSPKRRPTRAAKPKNLKENNLRKKIRR